MKVDSYYRMAEDDVIKALRTSREGLSRRKAERLLRKYGKNELQTQIQMPLWLLFLAQFRELLIIILIIGGLISLFIGDYRGTAIIFIIVLVNAIIGFIQEYRAGKIVDSLKEMLRSPAKVRRDGELVETDASNLVPGDIIVVETGDNLPADVRFIATTDFKTNEFALTGESVPREKTTEPLEADVGLADRTNMGYAGTIIVSGHATGVVVATGMDSTTGKIAGMTGKTGVTVTPLQEEMRDLARKLTVMVVIIGAALFVVGVLQKFSFFLSLTYALGVAMAVVPQALPAQVTVALTSGSSRLAARNAVVKNLPSVETLGSTTVICTDKTGTLTMSEMTVRSVWFNGADYWITGTGYKPKGDILNKQKEPLRREDIKEMEVLLTAATLASTAEIHQPDKGHFDWYSVGDPTEAAIVAMSAKFGIHPDLEEKEKHKLQEFSFDADRKRMSSVHRFGDEIFLAMKGSTESILAISGYIHKEGEAIPITEEDKQQICKENERYSENGMRVLAIANKSLVPREGEYEKDEVECDVTFLGLVAMIDPPKDGVREAVAEARNAGIRIFILTGDYEITAKAIAREIGLAEGGEILTITGIELNEMNNEALREILAGKESIIFSRVAPEDKLKIVTLLVELGEVVAVTGDGVNDAPALRKAHIGVAMGRRGTDVAKEAAKLVLIDDSFATLVYAIREGRTIYDNLKKTVFSTLTTNSGELTLVLFGLLGIAIWHLPLPILAVQILAIDLLGQIMPLTFLTFDPPRKGLMSRPPRDPKKRMLDFKSSIEVVSLGALIGGLSFLNFLFYIYREGIMFTMESSEMTYMRVTSLSYATIVFCQYINTLERRYDSISLFNRNILTNIILLVSIIASIGLVLIAIYSPLISDFLRFSDLLSLDWVLVCVASIIFLGIWEILKLIRRMRQTS
ncbi:MAG: cation-transporting P-type ATPase [Desulfobacterales bacterium]|nr:cation-transporting P-type ATPase [Desulfobacterales bacterium]